ncbi:MAG TPA: hypothetical protein VGH42_04110 [Verrucomicrobiae bacterium]|jgi:hypothetical protein
MKKIVLWGVISILIIGIFAASIWRLRRPQIITLSDGMKLTLLGVDYGRHHKYPTVKTTGHRNGGGPGSFDTTNDTLVVWILSEHKANQWPNYQVLVYDKAATACVGNWGNGNMRQIKNGMEVMGVQLAAFPRREGKIYLHIMNYGPRGQQVSKGQFAISNPARGKFFDKWTPDPLPDTQSDGDLDVTLTRLNYGVAGFNRGNGVSRNDPMSKAVLAAFHTEQKGVVVTNWQPVRIETSDATGNHAENNGWSNGRDDNGDATMTYQWGLWPDEPAWKLRVEFSKQSGFSDDEIWTVQNVPVNPGSQQDLWNYGRNNQARAAFAETTLNGIHLKLFPVIQFTDENPGDGEKRGGFRVEGDQPLDGMQLTLVKATDDQGRDVQSWSGQGWGGNSRQLQFQNLRNAKSLNLTIALHKSRFVEFTVKPEKPSGADNP